MKNDQKQLSKKYYNKSISHGINFDDTELETVMTNLVRLYAEDKEYEKITGVYSLLLKNYQESQALRKIETEERINKSISLSSQLEENQSLKKTNKEFFDKIRTRNLILILLLVLMISVIYTAIRLYKDGKVRKSLLSKIKHQNIELTGINKELAHSKTIITQQNQALASKNIELKNFAFVASHDLKAPARTIAIHLHHGQISIESKEGEGSTFTFTISKQLALQAAS